MACADKQLISNDFIVIYGFIGGDGIRALSGKGFCSDFARDFGYGFGRMMGFVWGLSTKYLNKYISTFLGGDQKIIFANRTKELETWI